MTEQKKYELAYLASSSIAEEEILSWSGKLVKIIEDSGGLVRHQEAPKRRRLAYPIKKEEVAYLGWIIFSIFSDLVSPLGKKLRAVEHVLRHLIVEEVEASLQPLRIITPRPIVPQRLRPVIVTPITPPETKLPEEKLDLEELDKKLEEILGK